MPNYDYPLVRDTIVVNNFVTDFYKNYQGPGAVVILARTVTLSGDFRVDGWPLIIIADLFDGKGFTINACGVDATGVATAGGNGDWPGYLPGDEGIPAGPGGSGGNGENGRSGTHAGSVTLHCREARDVRILATGGDATSGAPGGNGAVGVDGFLRDGWVEPGGIDPDTGQVTADIEHPPVEIWGTSGGSGGAGGNGGDGGNGGTIRFSRITENRPPVFDVTPGEAGAGAPGGAKAGPGRYGEDLGTPGQDGYNGTPGAWGSITDEFVADDAAFGAGIPALIGSAFPNHWAPFRLAMGIYHYRQYNAPLGSDETHPAAQHARDAMHEISCALELQPDNVTALALKEQLGGRPQDTADGGQVWVGGETNALGLPRLMDLLPDFQTYKTAYDAAVPQLLQFLAIALAQLTAAQTEGQLKALVGLMRDEAIANRANLALDVPIFEGEKTYAEREVELLTSQLEQVRGEIEANLAAMADQDISIGDVVGKVAEVGAAVVGIIAAVPTLGASLVGLVPTLVTLSNAVLDNAGAVAKALLTGDEVDDKAVKDAYDKVDKKADAVIKSGKTIVNFVKVIKELGTATTPDNAAQVALVKRGVDVTHQLLLAANRVTLAARKLEAAQQKVANADGVIQKAADALGVIQNNVKLMIDTGMLALGLLRTRSDAAIRMAFRAQRSAEIYTLRDLSDTVHLDAGMLSAEVERQYYDREIVEPQLVQLLIQSWVKLLDPIRLSEAYLAYFDGPHGTDWYRKSFHAGPEIESLKATRRFSFRIDPDDLPPGHREAKVRTIRLALVGATHPNNNISCEIRRGAIYEHRLVDGSLLQQPLAPRMDRRPAKLGEPLLPEEGMSEDPPLGAPNSLSFWGRGVGGMWEISIPDDQIANGLLDLSGLSWIQFWVGYQYIQVGP